MDNVNVSSELVHLGITSGILGAGFGCSAVNDVHFVIKSRISMHLLRWISRGVIGSLLSITRAGSECRLNYSNLSVSFVSSVYAEVSLYTRDSHRQKRYRIV